MKINAFAAKNKGAMLEPFTYEKNIKESDILISVKYVSLTRGDINFIDNLWNDTKYPLVPGSEIFGIVTGKGLNVTGLEIGDFVGVGYQVSSCGNCMYCRNSKEQFCKQQNVLCVNDFGGLADSLICDNKFVFKIPASLQNPESVPLMCSGLTCYSGIKKLGVKLGDEVAVVGAGNLGHLAIKILNKMKCKITVFSHTEEKYKMLKEFGADNVINITDMTKEISCQYDAIISTTSISLDLDIYINMLKPDGRICILGIPSQKMRFSSALLADYAQRLILGSYIGSVSEMKELLEFASENDIKATANIYPLSDVNTVVDKIRKHEIEFSSIIKIT